MADRNAAEHGFGPVYDENSRVLILGSFPSVKSREESFYYAHPQNRFWPVLAALTGEDVPATVEQKLAFLKRNRIALYDVIERCTIEGSSDASIRDVIVTDLAPILAASSVGTRIFTNGAKAYGLYMKYQYPLLAIPATRLPSSSPANAAMSLDRLVREWGALIGQIQPQKGLF